MTEAQVQTEEEEKLRDEAAKDFEDSFKRLDEDDFKQFIQTAHLTES